MVIHYTEDCRVNGGSNFRHDDIDIEVVGIMERWMIIQPFLEDYLLKSLQR